MPNSPETISFRTAYGKVFTVARPAHHRVSFDTGRENQVQQHQKDLVDVNKIMARALKTGEVPMRLDEGQYMDLVGVGDLHAMQVAIAEARSAFMDLPAQLRKRFDNDAANMVEFLSDESNLAEAIELGLVEPREGAGDSPSPNPSPATGEPKEPSGDDNVS